MPTTNTLPHPPDHNAADLPLSPEKDPRLAAKSAKLRYVSDNKPGITRTGDVKTGFQYHAPNGGDEITDEAVLQRIRSLAIPPAYTDVWICPLENGHLQATGRDERGRKQYRYHPRWRTVRDETKYTRMIAFGEALPRIRKQVHHDLCRPGLPREKVLATLVRLLESTLIRVGNEEYAKTNDSFGLTTMQMRHVDVHGSKLHFSFKGKSNKYHEIDLRDRNLAKIVERCKDLPGNEVFEFVDENGQAHPIHSEDVNAYIHQISGEEFTAKDFRTWAGTTLACITLCACEECDELKTIKHNIVEAVKQASEHLGNTPAVCRKSYIHPEVLAAYEEGKLRELVGEFDSCAATGEVHGLKPDESAVLAFLKARLAH